MPAPIGNKNAQKWNYKKITGLISDIELLVDKEPMLYLGQALGFCGAYSELWSRIKRKYSEDEDIYDRMMIIEQKFEAKIVVGAMHGKYNASTSQLILKTKYGFAPPVEQEKEEADSDIGPWSAFPFEEDDMDESFADDISSIEKLINEDCPDCDETVSERSLYISRADRAHNVEEHTVATDQPHTGGIYAEQQRICAKVRKWNAENPADKVPESACHMMTDIRPPFSHYAEMSGGFFMIL